MERHPKTLAFVILLAFVAGLFTGVSAQWHQFGHPPALARCGEKREMTVPESLNKQYNLEWDWQRAPVPEKEEGH